MFRRALFLIFHRLFRRHFVDEAGNAHAAFERFVVFEVQFGRFEEFDAFRQLAAQVAFGVFQGFFGDVAGAVVEDGVEHGGVAVIAGDFDFVDGDEACARVFSGRCGPARPVRA